MDLKPQKARDYSIDVLKFFAVVLITNSHFEKLYHPYEFLSTGGAIGDALFFFCSGYTLFLSKKRRFDNYYKRRILRIYPTVFAWSIICAYIFKWERPINEIIQVGGGWFVMCIMVYYIFFWFIHRYFIKYVGLVFCILGIACVILYFLIERPLGYNMYAEFYKLSFFFVIMLMGGIMGMKHYSDKSMIMCKNKWALLLKFVLSVIIYYGLLWARSYSIWLDEYQIITIIPFFCIVYYFYFICRFGVIVKIYKTQYIGRLMSFISGLCLEIYLVQDLIITDFFNFLFPLNIFIVFGLILLVAYLLKCCSILFLQTFQLEDYDWKKILGLAKE